MTTNELRNALPPLDLELSEEVLDRLCAYAELLVTRNKDLNLIGPDTESSIATRHFLDSLAPIRAGLSPDTKLIDVGSGAGLPGLPLAIVLPKAKVTLLDSLGKRCAFLKECADALGLDNVTVLEARAEEAARTELRESFDAATARAVTRMSALCELCLPLLRKGGTLYAFKTARAAEEIEASKRASKLLGGEMLPSFDYDIDGARMRLAMVKKVTSTPQKYPRPWGKIKNSEL